MNNTKISRLIGMALVGLLLVLSVNSYAIAQSTPQILPLDRVSKLPPNCLPDPPKAFFGPANQLSLSLTGRVRLNGDEYRAYNVESPLAKGEVFQHVVKISGDRCQRLATDAPGNEFFLRRVMPLEGARLLYLAQLQLAISRAGGKEAFQQQLNQLFKAPPGQTVKISGEEKWALDKAGIVLPKSVVIVPSPK